MFYITNQIMKPLQQLFGLILEDITEFKPYVSRFKRQVNSLQRKYTDLKKFQEQEEKLRNTNVKKLIFDDSLLQANNDKLGQNNITKYINIEKTEKKGKTQQTNKIIKKGQQTTFAEDYKNSLIQQTIQRFLS